MKCLTYNSSAFDSVRSFQNKLFAEGIAGNDLAVYLNGLPLYRYMTGYRDIENRLPLTRDTLFRMYSMTKPIAAVATLILWEQGAFRLTDPIEKYLPAYSCMCVILSDGKTEPLHSSIRVLDLLTMTAGFDYSIESHCLSELYYKTGCRHTTQSFAQSLASQPLYFQTGKHWSYSLSYDVLAAFLESVSGLSFGAILEKTIFKPLSLKSAGYHHEDANILPLCHAYCYESTGKFVPAPGPARMLKSPFFEGGGAGLIMTVDDYARFACTLTNLGESLDGVRILRKSTVEMMRENRLHGAQIEDFLSSPMGHPGYGYGLGVRTLVDPKEAHAPCGKGEFGWGGALGTYVLMDPENHLTFVYAQQSARHWDDSIPLQLRDLLYSILKDS